MPTAFLISTLIATIAVVATRAPSPPTSGKSEHGFRGQREPAPQTPKRELSDEELEAIRAENKKRAEKSRAYLDEQLRRLK